MSTSKSDFQLMLDGHGLTTAEILYHMPDHQLLLQSFTWQNYDLAPKFPNLNKFLNFWRNELEGPIHSVRYTHCTLLQSGECRMINGEFLLN